MRKKIICIDYGKKRIGLASADIELKIASPLYTLKTSKGHLETVMQLLEFTESKKINIDRFVIGLPLLLSGNESSMSHLVKQFGKILQDRSGKEVIFYDERLTSSEIDNLMKTSEINRKKRKDCIDELVATLILQTYLNQL